MHTPTHAYTDIHLHMRTLTYACSLLKGRALREPTCIHFERLNVSGVELNLEMSNTGVFNIGVSAQMTPTSS